MVRAYVDTRELRKLVTQMKSLDTDLQKYFTKAMKADLQPFANKIQNWINSNAAPPLSHYGGHGGRTAWPTSVKATAYVTALSRKSLARIEVFGRGANKAAVKIADLAGTTGENIRTTQGEALIQELNRRFRNPTPQAGRFVWQQFIVQRPQMIKFIKATINEFSDITERRVGKG